MRIWNQDKYIKAWNYASSLHNGQVVPGTDIPYINHVGLVAMEAMAAIAHTNTITSPDLLVLCAVLHDIIEDTNGTYNEIQEEFGKEVASGVRALSKNNSISSKDDQMKDSVKRIKNEPKEIWMVKLSDRITNLQPPPRHWSKFKISNYKKEAIMLLDELGAANNYLSERLEVKIEEYSHYE